MTVIETEIKFTRRGTGKPLLLVHGLGGSRHSWDSIVDALARERDVTAVDVPGSGETPPLAGENSLATLADALARFLAAQNLTGIDAVGSSMGARLVLELARRGVVGSVVSLDPGGFWEGWERVFFGVSVALSGLLVRALSPAMENITGHVVGRSILLAQFSARPWHLAPAIALTEMRTFASAPTFYELLGHLVFGEQQRGMDRGAARGRIVIGWGRQDRVCLPAQADRALKRFPDATVHWFDRCGHFPQWDAPEETVRLILATTI